MTIQRMAVVDADNKVVNVIIYDTEGGWSPPEGCILVDASEAGGPGDTWDGTQFVAPIENIPHPAWWQKQ